MLFDLLFPNVLLLPDTIAGGESGAGEAGSGGGDDAGSEAGEGGEAGAAAGDGGGDAGKGGDGDGSGGDKGGKPSDDDKQGDGGKDDGGGKDDDGKPKAPDSYDLKLPEGTNLDDAALEQITERARKLGLTQEQAEKLLEQENTNAAKAAEQQQETWKSQVEEWGKAVKSDKEIGGDKYDATVKASRQAVERFASPELKKALNETGFGNHPELVRCFAKIGKAMGEEQPASGSPGGGAAKDTASILYPGANDSGE